ncbi:hypothetical protein D3C87_1957220 [compost metagenome]
MDVTRDHMAALRIRARQMAEQKGTIVTRVAQLAHAQGLAVQGAVVIAGEHRDIQSGVLPPPVNPGIAPGGLRRGAVQHIAHDP